MNNEKLPYNAKLKMLLEKVPRNYLENKNRKFTSSVFSLKTE